jgi:hypothetical protein
MPPDATQSVFVQRDGLLRLAHFVLQDLQTLVSASTFRERFIRSLFSFGHFLLGVAPGASMVPIR